MMKHWKSVIVSLLATALLASSGLAQVSTSGVILPRKKTCEVEATGGSPGDSCTVSVLAKNTGLKCENGKMKVTLEVTISCPGETCRDYPTLDNCADDNDDFQLGCHGNTITLGSTSSWSELMGPNGSCSSLTAATSH